MFLQSISASFSFLQYSAQGIVRPSFQEPVNIPKNSAQDVQVTNESAQKIVSSQAFEQLEKILKTDNIDLETLSEDDFSPEKVADKIMSFVQTAFGRFRQAQPETDANEFFTKVREGLDKGFSQAKDILQNSGVLQGQIAENIDKTYDLTLQRMEELASSNNATEIDKPSIDATMSFQSLNIQQSRSAQIQVKTREGDVVTINFNQSSSNKRSSLQIQQDDFNLAIFQEDSEENKGLSISIEGDLNHDEQKALRKLLKKMTKVSNAFFHGDNKTALKHAMKLGLNDKQLASFSLNLNAQKSVQAIAAYQQTAAPKQNVQPGLLAQAGEFLDQAKTLLKDAETALQPLASPQQDFNELFSSVGLLSQQKSPETVKSEDQALFSKVVHQLGRNLFS